MTKSELLKAQSRQINELGGKLHEIGNLVAALQIICADMAEATIRDKRLNEIRSAVIGLGDALDEKVG